MFYFNSMRFYLFINLYIIYQPAIYHSYLFISLSIDLSITHSYLNSRWWQICYDKVFNNTIWKTLCSHIDFLTPEYNRMSKSVYISTSCISNRLNKLWWWRGNPWDAVYSGRQRGTTISNGCAYWVRLIKIKHWIFSITRSFILQYTHTNTRWLACEFIFWFNFCST